MEDNKLKFNLDKSYHELRQLIFYNSTDIEELLKKAYLLSIVTKQKDIEEWIINEQNGYKCVNDIPDYRYLRGELKAFNYGRWIPIKFANQKQSEMFSIMPYIDSVSSIIDAYKNSCNSFATFSISDKLTQELNRSGSFVTAYNFFVSKAQINQVISSIKNRILQWIIELEKNEKEQDDNLTENVKRKSESEKGSFILKKVNIFLSYCWDDSNEADRIYSYFKNNRKIELHRDTIEIGKWESIKEYMQSIGDVDYIILLISDAYLKSVNCMYEVLEVMRDRNYRDKIFPAVIYSEIYSPIIRAHYVKYWQDEFGELERSLQEINVQNLGKLHEDLKQRQDISSNIAYFLDVICDMNNPSIDDVCVKIEEKLGQKGLITNQLNNDNDLKV